MSATDQQARAIAFLACQIRPVDAPSWDQAGVVAKIAEDPRPLPDIALDAIACALDPEARTPGAIGKRPWRTRLLAVPTPSMRNPRPDEACKTCGRGIDTCALQPCDRPTTRPTPKAAPTPEFLAARALLRPTTGEHA